MLCLYLQAPFAAFRTFAAGSFRPTAEFITPSAAYGLLLNVAGIEMRQENDGLPMTEIKKGLPVFKLAIGAIGFPEKGSVYQQLHNYPVGTTGKENAERARGNKYNITPVKRSFLSDIRAYLCLDGNECLENEILKGLKGESSRQYGLPFLGDNSFLIDKLEPCGTQEKAHWYCRVDSDDDEGLKTRITRLSIRVDRADMSGTDSALFAPIPEASIEIPESAWVEVGY